MHTKSIDDYIISDESVYKTTVDNYSFYAEKVTNTEAINISNMLSLLGLDDDVVVAEEPIFQDREDFNRDILQMYSDNIDYDKSVYSASDGDYYFVWYEVDGTIRGLHLDADFNLIDER